MSPKSKESVSVRASRKSHTPIIVYRKIDLTLNFIDIEDLEESVDNLEEVPDI